MALPSLVRESWGHWSGHFSEKCAVRDRLWPVGQPLPDTRRQIHGLLRPCGGGDVDVSKRSTSPSGFFPWHGGSAGAVGAYPAGAGDSRFGIGHANPKRPAAASVRQHAQTATPSAVRRRGHAPRLATPVPAQAKWPWHVADGRTPKPSFGRRAAILARERPSYGTAT